MDSGVWSVCLPGVIQGCPLLCWTNLLRRLVFYGPFENLPLLAVYLLITDSVCMGLCTRATVVRSCWPVGKCACPLLSAGQVHRVRQEATAGAAGPQGPQARQKHGQGQEVQVQAQMTRVCASVSGVVSVRVCGCMCPRPPRFPAVLFAACKCAVRVRLADSVPPCNVCQPMRALELDRIAYHNQSSTLVVLIREVSFRQRDSLSMVIEIQNFAILLRMHCQLLCIWLPSHTTRLPQPSPGAPDC